MTGKDLEDAILEMKACGDITALERWNTIETLAKIVKKRSVD